VFGDGFFDDGFFGTSGSLRASTSQRDSVCCRSPVSFASCIALTALGPISRCTILVLNAGEKGLVMHRLPSPPRRRFGRARSDNSPGTGGRSKVLPIIPVDRGRTRRPHIRARARAAIFRTRAPAQLSSVRARPRSYLPYARAFDLHDRKSARI